MRNVQLAIQNCNSVVIRSDAQRQRVKPKFKRNVKSSLKRSKRHNVHSRIRGKIIVEEDFNILKCVFHCSPASVTYTFL